MLCDRDNLSPLKEFLDISSRVVSVAKTGLVKRRSDRNIASCYTPPSPPHPYSAPPTGQIRKNRATRKKRTLVLPDRNYHLVHRCLILVVVTTSNLTTLNYATEFFNSSNRAGPRGELK